MPLPQILRFLAPLAVGLLVGGVGAILFRESLPGSEGSPEERANRLEIALHKAQNRVSVLENQQDRGRSRAMSDQEKRASRRTLSDGARRIAEDLRDGRPVTPEDVFRASQPLMRDLAPLLDRMRIKEQQAVTESLTGELARKYNLTPDGREKLRQWFDKRAAEQAKAWTDLVAKDGTRLEDVLRASRQVSPDDGLDAFMPGILGGEKLAAFQKERSAERVQRIEQEADRKVQQFNSIVGLNEAQRDQVFGITARTSRDYDPSMAIQGAAGPIGATPAGDRQTAILSVLRPDQRAAYEAERTRRREEEVKNMEAIGLTLPPEWDMFEDGR